MDMNSAWTLFVTTGAPEAYLLYKHLKKDEENYVSDNSGLSDAGHGLQ